jgi:hypothetical protein
LGKASNSCRGAFLGAAEREEFHSEQGDRSTGCDHNRVEEEQLEERSFAQTSTACSSVIKGYVAKWCRMQRYRVAARELTVSAGRRYNAQGSGLIRRLRRLHEAFNQQ